MIFFITLFRYFIIFFFILFITFLFLFLRDADSRKCSHSLKKKKKKKKNIATVQAITIVGGFEKKKPHNKGLLFLLIGGAGDIGHLLFKLVFKSSGYTPFCLLGPYFDFLFFSLPMHSFAVFVLHYLLNCYPFVF